MDLTVIEQLSFSTVRIEATLPDGSISTGTGFFYAIRLEGKHIPLIITNKHVVENSLTGKLRFTLKNQSGEPDYGNHFDCQITDFKDAWTNHPDPDIDLCAMPIAEVQKLTVEKTNKEPFYIPLNLDNLLSPSDIDELIGMEEVKMIGYPNGLWDEINNMPLYRQGVLASNYKLDWNDMTVFIVDLSVFPGSSGSPIFLLDEKGYKTKNGTVLGATRFKLIGIVYAVFQSTVDGDIKTVKIPTSKKDIAVSLIPNNLGIAIKSHRLLDFESIFKAKLNSK
jgi:V8-like Glu-specific endopeptidase